MANDPMTPGGIEPGITTIEIARQIYCWGVCPNCQKEIEAVQEGPQRMRIYHPNDKGIDANHCIIETLPYDPRYYIREAQRLAEVRLGTSQAAERYALRYAANSQTATEVYNQTVQKGHYEFVATSTADFGQVPAYKPSGLFGVYEKQHNSQGTYNFPWSPKPEPEIPLAQLGGKRKINFNAE